MMVVLGRKTSAALLLGLALLLPAGAGEDPDDEGAVTVALARRTLDRAVGLAAEIGWLDDGEAPEVAESDALAHRQALEHRLLAILPCLRPDRPASARAFLARHQAASVARWVRAVRDPESGRISVLAGAYPDRDGDPAPLLTVQIARALAESAAEARTPLAEALRSCADDEARRALLVCRHGWIALNGDSLAGALGVSPEDLAEADRALVPDERLLVRLGRRLARETPSPRPGAARALLCDPPPTTHQVLHPDRFDRPPSPASAELLRAAGLAEVGPVSELLLWMELGAARGDAVLGEALADLRGAARARGEGGARVAAFEFDRPATTADLALLRPAGAPGPRRAEAVRGRFALFVGTAGRVPPDEVLAKLFAALDGSK